LSGVVKAHPEDEEALVSLARLESRLDSPEAGMRLLEEAAERNPGALLVRSELARAYQRAGRHDRVLEVTQNLGKKEFTKMPALLELRGVALMGTGDFVSAQGAFKQWSDLEPESARAHFLYGESLARAGNVNGASAELKRALELDAAYLPARVGEIKMLVSRNDVGAAGERLVALRKEFGPRREVLGIEGWFALGTNDFVTAADRFSTLLEDQRDTELMVLYIRSLWAQKKYDEAIEKMQAWLETDPKDLVVEIHLADAFVSLGRNDEARAAYARVVEQYPDNLPALNNLATLGQEQDLAGSIKYAEHAYKLAPHDPIVMDTLGALLQKGGDRARGERLIQDAARLAPEDAQIQVHFAKVLADNGRTAEAKQVLEKVIDNAGDSRAATAARAALESLP
jgi:putative PEP-CTERM system TPR-repeat lipoprotein